jgi:hypothetical protein
MRLNSHPTIVKGDRVRLSATAAQSKTNRRHYVDWHRREGTVMNATERCVMLIWDGRTSISYVSPKTLELST